MNDKNEAKEAIMRIGRIIEEWEENKIESRTALELLNPDIKTVISQLERIQDEVAELKKRND